ncbi:laminarinase [Algibacter marinivivus]|uniref:Laminarinase n=2 Tax=Algibacter marinivivus TaxID=2100723 RepID=A0A2U2X3E7_9FLAO|nr:laminarinase [Algibacter marinivivus]
MFMLMKIRIFKIACLLSIILITGCSKENSNNEINNEPEVENNLIFSDEFDSSNTIDTSKWKHEVVPPNNGSWWNGEKQHYTSRTDNSYISNGTLKIVAKKETYSFQNSTKNYTSARINSKFSFTYGRVDVRAKLPSGIGTWPAIWMLGSNITSVGWPACGEIDIMEHWGHQPAIITSATHNPACHGGCPNVGVGKTTISDYDTAFHVYSIIWNENEIQFLIDDDLKYTYNPEVKNADNWPYTKNQFLILNVAMGGEWFTIDPNFEESIMEIDYVRVYKI